MSVSNQESSALKVSRDDDWSSLSPIRKFRVVQRLRAEEFNDLKAVHSSGADVAAANFYSVVCLARVRGWTLVSVSKKYHMARALVLDKPGESGARSECWASILEKRAYRRIYETYLTEFRGMPPDFRLPSYIDVDHVLSMGLARHEGMSYVRLALSFKHANQINGSRERERGKNSRAAAIFGSGRPYKTPKVSVSGDTLGYRRFWAPAILKYLPRFIRPPSGKMPALTVLRTLRYLYEHDALPLEDVDAPFALHLRTFRLYAAGLSHHQGQLSTRAKAEDAQGRMLDEMYSLRDWLNAGPLIDRDPPEDWDQDNSVPLAFGEG